MQRHQQLEVSTTHGLTGDYRGARSKRRQVTLLSAEDWHDVCEALGAQIPWYERRANLLISGYRFSSEDVGKLIRIGSVLLEVTTDTPPCRRLDPLHPGLVDLLRGTWKAGASVRVLEGGLIRAGDELEILDEPPASQLSMDI